MPKKTNRFILTILLFVSHFAFAQMQLKIVLDTDGITYKIFAKSDKTYKGTQALITTSQISIVVPHGTGNNRFLVENITSPISNMRWRLTDRIDAPIENPEKDYLFFSFINNQSPLVLFDITAGQEFLLFSFTRKGNCIGKANLVEAKNDAFWPPNSQNTNIGINFTIVGAGGNAYKSNYDAPPIIQVKADNQSPCAGARVNFSVSVSQSVPKARFQWFVENVLQKGANSQTFSYELPKNDTNQDIRVSVSMIIDETNACDSYSTKAQTVLNVRGTPTLDWLEKINNCTVFPAKLKINVSQYADILWEKDGQPIIGAKSAELQVTQNGKYAVKASLNGCLASLNSLNIVGVSKADDLTADAGKDTTILEGEPVVLQAQSKGGIKFDWTPKTDIDNPTTLTPTIFPKETTTYQLTAEDQNGCKATDEITVNVLLKLYIPNTFTPNNDGDNDDWVIQNSSLYSEFQLDVFNRWGNSVFRSENYTEPWNGILSNGQKIEAGTYYYQIKTNRKNYSGVLNILY